MRVLLMKEDALELQDLLADVQTALSNIEVIPRMLPALSRMIERLEARRLLLTRSMDEALPMVEAAAWITETPPHQASFAYFAGVRDVLQGEATVMAKLYGTMEKLRASREAEAECREESYGISPGPGACCPDQPNCKHCKPEKVKVCPECQGDMFYIGNPDKPHKTDYWECDGCGFEEASDASD